MCAFGIGPAIASERLILRAPTLGDAAAVATLANDPAVARMTAALPHPYGLSDAEAFLSRVAGADPEREPVFAIEHRTSGLVGMLGFHEPAPRRPELGYWLGRDFWGLGYATEAVNAALGWARRDWGRKVVWAGHFSDNRASGEVLCKVGFLYTGDVTLDPCVARGAPVPCRKMVWLA